jgi:tetratricopeptide (TPR) repeat protein
MTTVPSGKRSVHKTYAQRIIAVLLMVLVLSIALSCNSYRAERHYERGIKHLQKGRSAQAVKEFWRAIHLNPGHSKALFKIASVYESEGLLEQARGVYQELMQVDPAHAEAECKLAGVYSRLGQWQDAVTCFNSVISKHPARAEAYYGLATIYRRQQQNRRAVSAYEKAIECNAMFFEAHYALSVRYYIEGAFEAAGKHAAIAQQHYPSAQKLLSLIEEELQHPSGRVTVSYHQ